MAKIIKVDGTQTELKIAGDKPTLEELQAVVNGLIELVYLRKVDQIMVVNEEGLIHNLPMNRDASALAEQLIVGDVVVCSTSEID